MATDGKTFTITTADGSTFATVGAGSIGTNELTTISGLTADNIWFCNTSTSINSKC